jgi:hypothetical protein
MKLFSLVIITIFFFSCSGKENRYSVITDKFKSGVPNRPGVNYFPTDSLFFSSVSKSPSSDSFVRRWYSEILYSLREPVLYNYLGTGQSIRFVWLRPFRNPVVVRLNNFDDTVYVNIKELKIKSSQGEVPKIVKDTIIALDVKKWQKSLSMLEANNFWNAITEDTLSNTIKDGTSWFLECRLPNKYHCINRSDNGDFASKDLNLYAKELLEISESYVRMKSSR